MVLIFDESLIVEPPKPIKKTEYFCDKCFHIESVIDLYDKPDLCGLIFINGENCELYTVDITTNDKTRNAKTNTRLKQHKKGGQSSARFGRLHDEKIVKYLKEISDEAKIVFGDLEKIVVAGISKRPEQLLPYLHTDILKKIIGTTVMTSSSNFNETIVPKMQDLNTTFETEKEIKVLMEFVNCIEKSSPLASYGEEDIQNNIDNGVLSKLYICSKSPTNKIDHNQLSNIKSKCDEHGTQFIEIGVSVRGQELEATFGSMFGVKWY